MKNLLASAIASTILLAACGGQSGKPAVEQAPKLLAATHVAASQRTAADYHETVQRIYVAYFGRPAEPGGLAYHAGVLLAAGAPTDAVALGEQYKTNKALREEIDSFGKSDESSKLYPGDNGQFVTAIYRNLFNRDPDPGGKAFWTGELDNNVITRGSAAVVLMAGAVGSDKDTVDAKVRAATAFTSQLVTPQQSAAYSGLAAVDVTRAMLAKIGGVTSAAAFTAAIDTAMRALLPGSGSTSSIPAMNSVAAKPVVTLPARVVISTTITGLPTVPLGSRAAPAGTNVKLWLYDPRTTVPTAMPTGIFLRNTDTGSPWQFIAASSEGAIYLNLANGNYEADTVEPSGSTALLRKLHKIAVNGATVTVSNSAADAFGYFPITLSPVVPEVQKLQDALRALAAEPAAAYRPTSACQLIDQVAPLRGLSAGVVSGFPKIRQRLPSYGNLRALIVPVDFASVPGLDDPAKYFTPLANDVRDFHLAQSYGRLSFNFSVLPAWVRLPFEPAKYSLSSLTGDYSAYFREMIALTEKQIDYSQYDMVYFLTPKEMTGAIMPKGPASVGAIYTSTGYVVNGAMGGGDMYDMERRKLDGALWKWMAHETGHTLGMVDEDLDHASATLGNWSIMAMNWSATAIEHNSWDRYVQGWLTDSQVACLTRDKLGAAQAVTLDPLVRQNGKVKAAMVPLSASKVLVAEVRRAEGYDKIAANHIGVLVYTVDVSLPSLGGGYRTLRRPGSTRADFEDAALRVGDSVTVDGVTVTVTASSAIDGDIVVFKDTK